MPTKIGPVCCAMTALALSGGALSAHAAVTQIQGGFEGIEPSVWNVLNALIGDGASLTQADINVEGSNLGGISGLSRVPDGFEELYTGGEVAVRTLGLFYDNGDIGNPFAGVRHRLFYENESVSSPAIQVTDNTQVLDTISIGEGQTFSLTAVRGDASFSGSSRTVDSSIEIASSIEAENIAAGETSDDRMVTFAIDIRQIPTLNGLDGTQIDLASLLEDQDTPTVAYVHFFDTGIDADYQDAIYLTVGATAIPTPGALALFASAGVIALRRRR